MADGSLVEYRAVAVDADGDRAAASGFGSVRAAVDGAVPPDEPGGGDLLVTVPGSHNSEMGCPGDWQPDCLAAQLTWRGGTIYACLLYTSDAADDLLCVDLGGRRII